MGWAQKRIGNKDRSEAGVVIIGAGISGICAGIDLIKNGIHNFVIIEKSGGLGGTWRDNAYPGCCCDIASYLYSFSFEQNPGWSRLYPGQEEILDYLIRVSEKYNLYRYIRFNSVVDEASWDDTENQWITFVKIAGGKDAEFASEYRITSDFLISAVGQLNQPAHPNIPGLHNFKGKTMHSARWDWTCDLKGKRIGIIGNGATAVQIAPEIAKDASQLTICQRTPNWVVPRMDISIPTTIRALFRYLPPARWMARAVIMNMREKHYDALARSETTMSKTVQSLSIDMMKKQLSDQPDMWEKLTPTYPPGCKRVIISDDYFPALNRQNVSLETGHIDEITESGIIANGVQQELDVLVLATGFRTVEFMYPIKVTGRGGRSLGDIWKGGARALYGITVESLPNFGMLYGPNTNLGHNSIILMIEAQARYVNKLVSTVLRSRERGDILTITPKADQMDGFNADMQKTMSTLTFAHPNCNSWYKTHNGLVTNNWPNRVTDYQMLLSELHWDDFDLSGTGADTLSTKTSKLGRVVEESFISYRSLVLMTVSLLIMVGGSFFNIPGRNL